MKKYKLIILIGITIISFVMPTFAEKKIDREKAIQMGIDYNEVFEKHKEAEEEMLRSIRPIRNGAAAQRGFQSDYHMIIRYMGDQLADDFYLNFEEQFQHFYSIRVIEPALLANFNHMRLEKELLKNRMIKQVDTLFLALIEAEIAHQNQVAYWDYLRGEFAHNQYRFDLGELSENALRRSEIKLELKEIELALSKLAFDQAEAQMKHLLGIDAKVPIAWEAGYGLMTPVQLEPVETYIEHALENRIELKKTASMLQAKKDTLALYKEIHFNLHERERASFEVDQMTREGEVVQREIEHEIRKAYLNVLAQKSAYESAHEAFERAREDYVAMMPLEEAGHQTKSQQHLKRIELNELYTSTMLAYMKYNVMQRHFEMAIDIGPAFY